MSTKATIIVVYTYKYAHESVSLESSGYFKSRKL